MPEGHPLRRVGRLHVIVGTAPDDPAEIERLARLAVAGGADTIQFRRKHGSTRELIRIARKLAGICRQAGIPLIVNDRVDVAIAADAQGVHLGADDFPISLARELLGPDRTIGASSASVAQAQAASLAGADYIGAGPVYPTANKSDAGALIGADGVRSVAASVEIPVIAIGGISSVNAGTVISAGAWGIAVIGAVASAAAPDAATRELLAAIGERSNA